MERVMCCFASTNGARVYTLFIVLLPEQTPDIIYAYMLKKNLTLPQRTGLVKEIKFLVKLYKQLNANFSRLS